GAEGGRGGGGGEVGGGGGGAEGAGGGSERRRQEELRERREPHRRADLGPRAASGSAIDEENERDEERALPEGRRHPEPEGARDRVERLERHRRLPLRSGDFSMRTISSRSSGESFSSATRK